MTNGSSKIPVVVIGHTGFIGSAIAHTLAAKGVPVVPISTKQCNLLGADAVQVLEGLLPEGARVVFCSAITRLVRDSYETMLQNIQMVETFASVARRRRLTQMIYLSTSDVYGHRPSLPITEESLPSPETYYALSKLTGEQILRKIGQFNYPVAVLRLPGVYGIGSDHPSAVGRLARQICEDGTVTIFGDGNVRRDYIEVDDVCATVEALLEHPYDGVLNLATGASISILELVHLIARHARKTPAIKYAPAEPNRAGDQIFDIARLSAMLPTVTITSIETGVARYLRYLWQEERVSNSSTGPHAANAVGGRSHSDSPILAQASGGGRIGNVAPKGGAHVVILGASGFIGTALFEHFSRTTDLPVIGYRSSHFDLTKADCVDKLRAIVNQDTILIVTARARTKDAMAAVSGDVAIAVNVARCLMMAGARKCVYFSTTSVYDDTVTNLSITEDTPVGMSSLYGIAKFTGERLVCHAAEKAGIPVTILRPCMVYGPGDTSQAYGPARFIQSILREGKVSLFGDGSECRDYLFIRDLVAITSRLMESDVTGTYNVGTGQSHTFQDLIACLRVVMPVPFDVVYLERDRPKADQRLDPAQLLRVIPGFRFTELMEGLEETSQYFSAKYAPSRLNI